MFNVFTDSFYLGKTYGVWFLSKFMESSEFLWDLSRRNREETGSSVQKKKRGHRGRWTPAPPVPQVSRLPFHRSNFSKGNNCLSSSPQPEQRGNYQVQGSQKLLKSEDHNKIIHVKSSILLLLVHLYKKDTRNAASTNKGAILQTSKQRVHPIFFLLLCICRQFIIFFFNL